MVDISVEFGGDRHRVVVCIFWGCDICQTKNGMMWRKILHVFRCVTTPDVSQLVTLGSLVGVDIFDVVVALVASIYWLFDNVLDGPVHPFFLPQIAIPTPHFGLTVDVRPF
jgi:hypothetical protein